MVPTNLLTPDRAGRLPGQMIQVRCLLPNISTSATPHLAIQVPAAGDEGGNFIRPKYNPLALYNDAAPNDGDPGTLFGDYHILPGSAAQNSGSSTTPVTDIDGDNRTVSPDIGADETLSAAPAVINSTNGTKRGRQKSKRTR